MVFIVGINIVFESYKRDPVMLEYGYIFAGLIAGFLSAYSAYRAYRRVGRTPPFLGLASFGSINTPILMLMPAFS